MNEKRWKDPDQEYASDIGAEAEVPAASANDTFAARADETFKVSPTWTAPYEKEQQSAVRRIESQQPFSYDPESDPTYRQYRDTYTRMGEKARDDTIGVLRSRGGGQVSSYAGIAAQQAEEAYMQELADKVPQLRQLAYDMWLNEGDRARSDLQMYDALNSADAARWGATVLDPFLRDRDYAFSREQFQDSTAYRDKAFDYQVEQDALDRAERQDNTAYERQVQKAALLVNTIGDYQGYAELFGLDKTKVEAMVAEYAKDKALTEAQAARELADWYAQYRDFSKLQELGVNTSYLEQERDQSLGGTQGNEQNNSRTPPAPLAPAAPLAPPAPLAPATPQEIAGQFKDLLTGTLGKVAGQKMEQGIQTLRGHDGEGASLQNMAALKQEIARAARNREDIQPLMDAVWDDAQYSNAQREELLKYAKSFGYNT